MPNKQPFYMRAVVLFTATRDIDKTELLTAIKRPIERIGGVVSETVEIDECDGEPGDPAELL